MDSVFLVEVPLLSGVVTTARRHCYRHRIPSLMLISCTSSHWLLRNQRCTKDTGAAFSVCFASTAELFPMDSFYYEINKTNYSIC
ncbi:hypothetical protein VIGAN_01349700 [Vigna angularis var. angularis]|uniref:Uncharacterized protein n=1 Tax=Vigna angularis var. angularis TaxID=157739 RepID=A0A0S3R4V9_PHAAN|nr:hypothetical protein VIGAN_01349700 [Vigna angularis var. angularis]